MATVAAPAADPDLVDDVEGKVASIVGPGGDQRVVALNSLPAGARADAVEGDAIRARLAAGDPGGTIDLDASGTAQPGVPPVAPTPAASPSTVMSPLGSIPATTPGLPPATDVDGVEFGQPVSAAPTAADAYIDSVIRGGSEPAAPSTPAIPPTGADGLPPDSQDIQKRIEQSTQGQEKDLEDVQATQEQGAQDVARARDEKAELQRQQAADLAAEQLYVRDRQAALDKEDAENLAKARDQVIPDFWESRQGDLVGAAITAALSGAAAGLLGSTHNAALEAIQHNVDGYFTQQRQKIDGLYKYAEQKGLLNDKARAQYAGELTDLMQNHAYVLQAAADRVQEVSDEAKGLVDAKQTAALKAQLEGRAATELQAARKIDIDRYDAETKRKIAEADELKAQAAMAKAHKGAGGGGGGAGMDVEGLAHALKVGADDGKGGRRPLTYDEQVAAAKQFKVPIDAKAGKTSLKSVIERSAFDAKEADREAKVAAGGAGGVQADRLVSKEADAWRKENHLDDLQKRQDELGATLNSIKNAPHNPLEQALAIEKAVSAARGGAASRQALDLALHHLGGRWANLEAFIQGAKTGEVGQKQMDNFVGFVNDQYGTAQKEGKDKYDAFNRYVQSQPAAKQDALKAQRGRLFSGLYGFGGRASAEPAAAGGGSRTLKPTKGKYAGREVTVDADNNILSVK